MATWVDALSDAGPIKGVYRQEVPSLAGVVLHEICLHRDGPRITLRFDLPSFPADPPKKWVDQGFGIAQIELMLIGIEKLSLQGWSNQVTADVSIVYEGERIRARLSSAEVNADITAESALVSSISAYRE